MWSKFRQRLATILNDHESRAGKIFDLSVQGLILVSLVLFCLETVPSLVERFGTWMLAAEVVIVVAFTIEYVLRVIAAERKLEFIFSFYGIVDLLAIAPFFLIPNVDTRAIRIVRVFRLFRVLKLVRYNHALARFHRVIMASRAEFGVFFLTAAMVIFLASVGIYHCESEAQPEDFATIFHAMWWAVVTLTTVGYGDVVPVTAAGKLFTMLLLITGLAIVAVPSGILASALTADAREMADDATPGQADATSPSGAEQPAPQLDGMHHRERRPLAESAK